MNGDADENNPYRDALEVVEEKKALTSDDVKIQFKRQSLEDEVEIAGQRTFSGLSKEELLKFDNDPFWRRLRTVLMVLFWLVWLGMLAIAVLIVVFNRDCPYDCSKEWVRRSAVYHVAPGVQAKNGFGDLRGKGEGINVND